jgi:hypothetical protein
VWKEAAIPNQYGEDSPYCIVGGIWANGELSLSLRQCGVLWRAPSMCCVLCMFVPVCCLQYVCSVYVCPVLFVLCMWVCDN